MLSLRSPRVQEADCDVMFTSPESSQRSYASHSPTDSSVSTATSSSTDHDIESNYNVQTSSKRVSFYLSPFSIKLPSMLSPEKNEGSSLSSSRRRNQFFVWGLCVACSYALVARKCFDAEWHVHLMSTVKEDVQPPIVTQEPWNDMLYGTTTTRQAARQLNDIKPRTWPYYYDSMPVRTENTTITEGAIIPTSKDLTELRRKSRCRKSCRPKSEWHSYSFPTCNSMHELDFMKSLNQEGIEYKFGGATRESWLVTNDSTENGKDVILKTLRWPIRHDEIVYDHQRIDALASERLTASPHVIDIYGFCGVSAMNEYADGGNFGRTFRQMNNTQCNVPGLIPDDELLVYARDAALGLADIHEIDGPNETASLVHHDFSAKNFLTVGGKLKVSDFNDGQLLRWNFERDERCWGFNWDGKCGTHTERTNRRAPEECQGDKGRYMTTEKVETHHLGSVFFMLLTGASWPFSCERTPDGQIYKPDSAQVKEFILVGAQPTLPMHVEQSNSTAIQAIVRAMRSAYTFHPEERPSARVIANELVDVSNKIQEESKQ